MKIIISPAKKMKIDTDSFSYEELPQFMKQTETIFNELLKFDYTDLKELWQCSDKIAQDSYRQLHEVNLSKNLTPAIMAYVGIQYQHMAPDLFTEPALQYISTNLRILSGFYGVLRPFDGIVPYRLEMQSRLPINHANNLYDYWNDLPYQGLNLNHEPIINLASQEYSKIIRKHMKSTNKMIDIVFGHLVDGKLKTRATFAKMARGEMVRFMAENNVTNPEELKQFKIMEYEFQSELSTDDKYVFLTTL